MAMLNSPANCVHDQLVSGVSGLRAKGASWTSNFNASTRREISQHRMDTERGSRIPIHIPCLYAYANAMTSYVFGTFVSAQQKFEEFDDLQTFLDAYIVLVLFGICYIFAAGAFVFGRSGSNILHKDN